jgi:hypothetical protein
MEDSKIDKDEFDNAIKYFQSIINNNISTYSQHKMGATFIGIKTNISGKLKLHIYILFFPFIKNQFVVPYCHNYQNIYFKDLCFDVDDSFYLWIYQEMKRLNSIVIMSLDSYILKVIPSCGDGLINIDTNCKENKEWMDIDYETWFQKQEFNNEFSIKIMNPHLYMVPFPVKPIIIKTIKRINNYVTIL